MGQTKNLKFTSDKGFPKKEHHDWQLHSLWLQMTSAVQDGSSGQEYVGKLYSEEEGVSPPSLIGLKASLEGNALFPPLMKQMNKSGVEHDGRCLQPLQCSDKTGAC